MSIRVTCWIVRVMGPNVQKEVGCVHGTCVQTMSCRIKDFRPTGLKFIILPGYSQLYCDITLQEKPCKI